ncbi:putative short-subunit dehydrogenase-like oxidoreductase (DUF2520 family) [Acinetobacter baylyi]|uniref:Short-subunit dehydrogenase-like oxidoreductase (DUF2520 family) n=1 Tax=Acinetobacter baylyi TaxID=202950 RepID=A0ABU0UUN1_ACIBI|nr:Rossmann-like and DUF2520 domain-containing protein [Acinetobacter baylyi]MDQ1207998.1 putative short-subunit dehydrogenase-like oxidoreductase (DUF2520 family) [Acinetobacter baylyi]MDR6104927.1 putative short-subunit dehydrogenase-like oxidoreductase (DUF2520 family) [Acinetobacter baylyi]MDR6184868.1 putative short-subunit dehydrogenase-like oxidoreductase (DUF2520 family) [Acinetobacter baylyi]
MRISFIGSGKVATHLASACALQHQIVQIMSRDLEHATTLACRVGAEPIHQFEQLDASIDLLIISVSDHAISSVIQAVHPYMPNTLIVHTSGSTDVKILSDIHSNAGVFYPLQTFSFERDIHWSDTPLLIEAEQANSLSILNALANSLTKRVYHYSSTQRLSLHLAAVFACNFSNYCYDMAKQTVDQAQVDFSLLYPLILETAKKATQHDPVQVQTGPAVRYDHNIVELHQNLLLKANRPDLKDIYQRLSQAIIARHHTQP